MVDDSAPVRLNTRFFLALAVLFTVGTAPHTACSSSPVLSHSSSTPRPSEMPKQAGTPSKAPFARRLICPAFGSPAALQTKGEHRVILSWRASAPADSRHAAAAGYCIYRGVKHKDTSPTLVNSTPFPGTTCTDDVVENGKKYYYVVRAISATGITSIISHEAVAPIPRGELRNPSATGASAPSCQEPVSVK